MRSSLSPSPFDLYAPSTSRRLGGGVCRGISIGYVSGRGKLTCSSTCQLELMVLWISESGAGSEELSAGEYAGDVREFMVGGDGMI